MYDGVPKRVRAIVHARMPSHDDGEWTAVRAEVMGLRAPLRHQSTPGPTSDDTFDLPSDSSDKEKRAAAEKGATKREGKNEARQDDDGDDGNYAS